LVFRTIRVINSSKLLPLVESFLDIDDLLGVREVYWRSCSGEIQEFTKNMVLELVWACSDVLSLDDPEIKDIEAAFVTTYNAAASTYSDPFFRALTDADIF
jgi:hypothetical protein